MPPVAQAIYYVLAKGRRGGSDPMSLTSVIPDRALFSDRTQGYLLTPKGDGYYYLEG